MNVLADQIEGLKFLKEGWNHDKKHPAPPINRATINAAKKFVPILNRIKAGKWRVEPAPDGSILFIAKNITVSVGSV